MTMTSSKNFPPKSTNSETNATHLNIRTSVSPDARVRSRRRVNPSMSWLPRLLAFSIRTSSSSHARTRSVPGPGAASRCEGVRARNSRSRRPDGECARSRLPVDGGEASGRVPLCRDMGLPAEGEVDGVVPSECVEPTERRERELRDPLGECGLMRRYGYRLVCRGGGTFVVSVMVVAGVIVGSAAACTGRGMDMSMLSRTRSLSCVPALVCGRRTFRRGGCVGVRTNFLPSWTDTREAGAGTTTGEGGTGVVATVPPVYVDAASADLGGMYA